MRGKYNPDIHHRRSIRLSGHDYSRNGAYFVTVCTEDRECLFGDIVNGEMVRNEAGQMVQSIWEELPERYPGVGTDSFVVMPNHIHGIIVLKPVGAGPRARPDSGQPRGVAPAFSLPEVVHRFKSLTTTRYRQGVIKMGWPPFSGRFWQRNYYEHIIRDEDEWNRIREYVIHNPGRWIEDESHPTNRISAEKMLPPEPPKRRRIGFYTRERNVRYGH